MSLYIPISEAIAIVAKRRGLPVDREGRCDPAWQRILTEARCGELKMRYRGKQGALPVQRALLNYVAAYPIQDTVLVDAKEAFRGGIEPPILNHLPGLTVNCAQLDALCPEPMSSVPLADQPDMASPTLWTWNQALAWYLWRDLARAANPQPDLDGNYPSVYGTVAEFRRAVDDGLLSQPEPGLFDAAQVTRVFPAPADRIANVASTPIHTLPPLSEAIGIPKANKRCTARARIADKYPNGIPDSMSDKEVARATRVSDRTVRRVRSGR
jgi:hypothetical protein